MIVRPRETEKAERPSENCHGNNRLLFTKPLPVRQTHRVVFIHANFGFEIFVEEWRIVLDNCPRFFILHLLNKARLNKTGGKEKTGTAEVVALKFSCLLPSGGDTTVETLADKDTVNEIRTQWKKLWRERIDDKVKAEGIASVDYSMLFVEKGTVVFATRDFKPLSLTDILTQHRLNANVHIPPDPSVGGWGKFIRTTIGGQAASKRIKRRDNVILPEKRRQHLKKGGRGWLHLT